MSSYVARHLYAIVVLAQNLEMRGKPLKTIGGAVPNLLNMPPGCAFQPRCKQANSKCAKMPPLAAQADGSKVACWAHEFSGNPDAE